MLIIANWKANKTISEALEWTEKIKGTIANLSHEIIIAPAFTQISMLKDPGIKLCAQTVSSFDNGQYTGEVTAAMLNGLIDYCLVGHSERRKYFKETTADVELKVSQLVQNKIKPVICAANYSEIPEISQKSHDEYLIMFEPPETISQNGIYQRVDPDIIQKTVREWKQKYGCQILYGGSVNLENIKAISQTGVNGFVVGHASLDPNEFIELLKTIN